MTATEVVKASFAIKTAVELGEALAQAGGAASSIFDKGITLPELLDIMGRNNIHFIYKAPTK